VVLFLSPFADYTTRPLSLRATPLQHSEESQHMGTWAPTTTIGVVGISVWIERRKLGVLMLTVWCVVVSPRAAKVKGESKHDIIPPVAVVG